MRLSEVGVPIFYFKRILTVVLALGFVFIIGCSSSTEQNTSSSSDNWLEGGTLHRATVGQWKSGTYSSKLATSADWLATTVWKDDLDSASDFEKLKEQAQVLVAAVDGVVTVEKTDSLKVSEIAAVIILGSNEFGP